MWEVVGIRLRISTPSTCSGARANGAFQSHLALDKLRRSPRKAKARAFVDRIPPGLLDRGVHEERHALLYAAIRAGCPVTRRPGSRWSRAAIGSSSASIAGSRRRSAGAVTTATSIARRIAPGPGAGSPCVGPVPATNGPSEEPGDMLPGSGPGGSDRPRK